MKHANRHCFDERALTIDRFWDESIYTDDSIRVFVTLLHSKVHVALPTEIQKKILCGGVCTRCVVGLLQV